MARLDDRRLGQVRGGPGPPERSEGQGARFLLRQDARRAPRELVVTLPRRTVRADVDDVLLHPRRIVALEAGVAHAPVRHGQILAEQRGVPFLSGLVPHEEVLESASAAIELEAAQHPARLGPLLRIDTLRRERFAGRRLGLRAVHFEPRRETRRGGRVRPEHESEHADRGHRPWGRKSRRSLRRRGLRLHARRHGIHPLPFPDAPPGFGAVHGTRHRGTSVRFGVRGARPDAVPAAGRPAGSSSSSSRAPPFNCCRSSTRNRLRTSSSKRSAVQSA